MIQLWSAVAVSILTVVVGPLLRGEVSGRLAKRIANHADLRQKIDGNSAAIANLDSLLTIETAALMERETHRLTRKINGANMSALIFVALAGGGLVYGLISVAVALAEVPVLYWIFLALAVLAGLLSVGLAAVGIGTLYAPPKEPKAG